MEKQVRITGIFLVSLGILVFLSLLFFNPQETSPNTQNQVQHDMGIVGFYVSNILIRHTIGYAAFIFPMLILVWGINLLLPIKIKHLLKVSFYLLLFALYVSMILAIFKFPHGLPPEQQISMLSDAPWGLAGGWLVFKLGQLFGVIGSSILIITVIVISVMYIIDVNIFGYLAPIQNWLVNLRLPQASDRPVVNKREKESPKRKRKVNITRNYPIRVNSDDDDMDFMPEAPYKVPAVQQPIIKKSKPVVEDIPDEPIDLPMDVGEYQNPSPAQTLDTPALDGDEVSLDEFKISAENLERRLEEFGIEGRVIGINPGPVITRYEIEPAAGVKINRFTSLADDLALVMRAKRIRVVAPIPGKAAIGIEIPNRKSKIVYFKEIVESPKFKNAPSPLTLALGMTIAGDVFVADLASMPHLLIAGSTGSGKSVCLHTIIGSILFKATPEEVQLVMIDPKRLELAPYGALKHHHLTTREDLGESVITNPNNAIQMLKSVEREMERRYERLAQIGVRNIADYNQWLTTPEAQQPEYADKIEKLPYIVLIIDELADLMLTAAREVEEPIARLAQMSRAVGIHLIVATQRPSVDVITGVIKANFPARIAFQVATKTDSRTIIDMNGAEKLLGKGDMLFIPPGSPEAIRIHNAFISHAEVKRLIDYIRKQPAPDHKTKLKTAEEMKGTTRGGVFDDDRDDLFDEAVQLVVRHQQGSASLLQRRLKIGYARAGRLIDQLEEAGIVGPADGSKAREVLITEDELDEYDVI
ncbi:DNA translocase FtsK [candidate division KSB1 bacterium]|nr:DNA translocase FtsK [candidate division KSB1 bacterium]